MMASNQPFGRVDDGIGAGLVSGAVVGGAMAGAAHMWGAQGISKLKGTNESLALSRSMGAKDSKVLDRMGAQHENVGKALNRLGRDHKRAFGGGWKGKAVAYGGSVLAAGLMGGVMDELND